MSEMENNNTNNEEEIVEITQQSKTEDTQANVSEAEILVDNIDEELPPSPLKRLFKEAVSWVVCIAIAFAAAFVIRTCLFTVVRVDGPSMNPTLQHNERLITWILGYTPERGDIVIFNPKSNPDVAYVKRVIATEGDRIWINETTGEVNLKKKDSDKWEVLDEEYILEKSTFAGIAQKFADDSGEGLLIEEDHVFVMGDNRNNSADSRMDFGTKAVGQVHEDSIIGGVKLRWWPLSEFGFVD